MIDHHFQVRLGELFEGPLDLLLHLVRTRRVEVRQLPLAEITGEYLEVLRFMESIELEPASEFLEVAATLVRLKARALLPQPPPALEAAAEEEALLERLVEHQVARLAARHLRAREAQAATIWFRGHRPRDGGEPEVVEADLFSLVSAFRRLLAELEPPATLELGRDPCPIPERIEQIRALLARGRPLPFEELFEAGASRSYLITTFLALLEMIRSGEARAYQDGHLGPIMVLPARLVGAGAAGSA